MYICGDRGVDGCLGVELHSVPRPARRTISATIQNVVRQLLVNEHARADRWRSRDLTFRYPLEVSAALASGLYRRPCHRRRTGAIQLVEKAQALAP